LGYTLWKGQLDPKCANSNPGKEWACYISPYAAPYINTPILIHTEQYDSFQIPWTCCSPSTTNKTEQEYVRRYRLAFSTSLNILKGKNGIFSGACYDHCFLENNQFNKVKIAGKTIQVAINEFFFEKGNRIHYIDDCSTYGCSEGC